MNRQFYVVLFVGLLVRFALTIVTGHPYDLGNFGEEQRLYYQYGTLDLTYFPTLPLIYYVQLLFYAPYELLRLVGLPDFQFFYHTTFMIESLFLKLPLILCDIAIFYILVRFTGKTFLGTLFFLNPFPIYLSSVWGIYDSLMLFPLLLGLWLISRGYHTASAGVTFAVSGLAKLFGFLPYACMIGGTLIQRRFREVLIEIFAGIAIIAGILIPSFIAGGYRVFVYGIFYRFVGLGLKSAGGANYNLFEVILGINPSAVLPTIPITVIVVTLAYSFESRRKTRPSTEVLLLKWTLVGAIAFGFVSASEPEWLSWVIPLGILYGANTGRIGLQYFSYVYGVVMTFLTMFLTQGTGYMLLGVGDNLIGYVEGIPGSSLLYATMSTLMLVMFSAYMLVRRMRVFRLEVVPLIVLLYLQAYFWIVIVGVGKFIGVA